ncbi:MAG: ATP-grasp domain-containing protein [Candidatus Cloacimonadaceae bacterium]|nr:ATP-grasp domain-containing protein [Candidatus Cloacimonadaceae bacterium]MDP3114875.1 ATP-grasp domain-containing protein [Candidatus Cloacimonadaceae bacterium]
MNPDLSTLDVVIAVSGLKTGDNPQPGVPVIRSIRNAGFKGKIIGLVYDSMESGIYLEGLADEIYQMPYPSTGAEAFMSRIDYILSKTKIDVIIPTLDAEIILFIRLEQELKNRGVHCYITDERGFLLRDKTALAGFFPPKGIFVPQTILVSDPSQIYQISDQIPYPLMVKGRYYEAFKARNPEEALKHYYDIQSRWGLPIIFQKIVPGEEFNIVIVGDGKGGMLGMVPQKKLVITDKGKGFGGVVVKNAGLDAFAEKVISILKWRGPCELEAIKGQDGIYYLIEINPRFPAWVRLAEGAGQNQPAAVVLLALGKEVDPLPVCKPGTMFIRHAEDLIADISTMGEIAAKSELIIGVTN